MPEYGYFQIGMLAYNLVNWFKELALDQKQHKTMLNGSGTTSS